MSTGTCMKRQQHSKKPGTLWAPHGDITVVYKTEIYNEQGERLNGCYVPDRRTILIDSRLEGYLLDEILEHEWLHAVLEDAGASDAWGDKAAEWVCRVLGKCLASRKRLGKW